MGKEKLRLPNYGGQALIEGVLMRGKYTAAAAMRAPDGRIVIESEKLTGIYTGKLAKIPFFRGIVILWDSLGLGTRFLTKSANVQTGENEKIEGATLYLTLAASFAIAILIFFLAPAAIGKWIQNLAGISSLAMNLIEGFIRLGAIILYIWVIGRTKDIADVFAYHGAEHKTDQRLRSWSRTYPTGRAKLFNCSSTLWHLLSSYARGDVDPGLFAHWFSAYGLAIAQPHLAHPGSGDAVLRIHPLDLQPSGFTDHSLADEA